MLIDFKFLFDKYRVKSKGVLHIGANTGQEAIHYKNNGIERCIWIEAIPEVFNQLVEHVEKYENTICINACIGDEDGKEVEFKVSSNEGQSSSFLELGTHAIVHPDVRYVRVIKMFTNRVSTIFSEMGLDMRDYTFLNIDLQGAEMYALRGMGALLRHVDYAYLEVNNDYLYQGCPLIREIDDFMDIFEFTRVEVHWAGNTGWGDAFYVKKNLL